MKRIICIMTIMIALGCGNEIPENQGGVHSKLFIGEGENLPLVVGFGGGEGGNAWASDRWKSIRDKFIREGYAFLAVGYFKSEGTPSQLDRISIEAIHNAILEAAKNQKIDGEHIALIGGSKGAELALLMASYYKDIDCVVAMAPGNCAFPALTFGASTSSWTYNGKEVPFVPTPWAAVPSLLKHDLRSAFEVMLKDKEAVAKALIKVENINGPILFISAKKDEMWPSTEMSNDMMKRLAAKQFQFNYEHITDDGGHTEVLDYFDDVLTFLEKNFKHRQ